LPKETILRLRIALSVACLAFLVSIQPVSAQSAWIEDFESGLDNWEQMLGEWTIEEEGGNHFLMTPLVLTAQPAGGSDPWIRLAPKGVPVTIGDGTIEFRAILLEPGGAGIILRPIIRGTDVDHCYWFSVDSRSQYNFMLLRVDIDSPNLDGYNATGEAYGNELPIVQGVIEVEVWYDVKIEITGNHWNCYLDGEKLIDYDDDPEWAYESGIIGFEIDCGKAAVDDVRITGVPELAVEPVSKLSTTWGLIKE
jgi:hypothetical protein